jgi:putative colanic acid biosynthesis UDP-glucose lipid carrier transferase
MSTKHTISKALANPAFPAEMRERIGWTISHHLVAPLAMTLDALLIIIGCLTATIAYHYETLGRLTELAPYVGLASITAVLFLTVGRNSGTYEVSQLLNLKLQIQRITARWSAVLLFLTALAFAMKVGSVFSRGATVSFAFFGILLLIGSRIGWRIFLANGVRKFSSRQVALISERGSAADAGILTALARHGLQPAQSFTLPTDTAGIEEQRSTISRAIAAIRGSDVEEVVICTPIERWPQLKTLISEFRILPLPVSFVPVGPVADLFQLPHHTIGDTLTIELQNRPRTPLQRAVKRLLDVVASATGLLLLMPLFLMTALAIKLDSPGPVIFRQRRCGFNGRQFEILKFRTMSVVEDGEHVVQASRNDRRVTRIGAWLRRSSIDELPQLFNVLKGDMSITGPRPHALVHDSEFEQLVAKYAYRHHVKPGITGWAQVNGHRGGTRTVADIERRVDLDLYYIDNWSLALDFRILCMTVFEVVRGHNAY